MRKTATNKIIISSIVLLVCCLFRQANAQVQPLYSQYMFNGAVINPAYMSMDESYNLNTVYRNQWGGFEGAPKTGTISFTMPAFTTNTSLGIMALQDKVGVDEETGVNLMLSQRVNITEDSYLALGVTGGFSYYRERNSELGQPNDPLFRDDNTLKRASVGLGLMYFSDRFFIGLSSPAFKKLTLADERAELQAVGHYYLSAAGNKVIRPKYDHIISFKEGFAVVKLNGKYGAIDKKGHEVVAIKYDDIDTFHEGVAIVKINWKYGVVDQTGKEIITPKYNYIYTFHDGVAIVELNRKYGIIDQTGKVIVTPKYNHISPFEGGFASVTIDRKHYMIDKSGNKVTPIN